jgi:hypothetical protein
MANQLTFSGIGYVLLRMPDYIQGKNMIFRLPLPSKPTCLSPGRSLRVSAFHWDRELVGKKAWNAFVLGICLPILTTDPPAFFTKFAGEPFLF